MMEFVETRFVNQLKSSPAKQVVYSLPVELGTIWISIDGQVHVDERKARFLNRRTKSTGFDLNIGYGSFISKDETADEGLGPLLVWLERRRYFESVQKCPTEIDFVTTRGCMRRILCTPYERREAWHLAVCKLLGSLYCRPYFTPEEDLQHANMTPWHRRCCYWGFKFEHYMTFSQTEPEGSSKDNPINNIEKFNVVLSSKLGVHRLLLVAEIDCVDLDSREAPPLCYVELKTSKEMTDEKSISKFSLEKAPRVWAQNFLAGVPKVLFGFRDDHGVVKKIQPVPTADLYQGHFGQIWSPEVCLDFGNNFLAWVTSFMAEKEDNQVYVFSFDPPFTSISVSHSDKVEHRVFPEWFHSKGNISPVPNQV